MATAREFASLHHRIHHRKLRRGPILDHFYKRTANGFTEECKAKIKMLKRNSHDIRNAELYWIKMLPGFVQSHSYFYLNIKNCYLLLDKIEKTV